MKDQVVVPKEVLEYALEFCKLLWREYTLNEYCENKRNSLEDMLHKLLEASNVNVETSSETGKWFTVVYKNIHSGVEAQTLGEHPKVSAMSWSHAMYDRDEALARLKHERSS